MAHRIVFAAESLRTLLVNSSQVIYSAFPSSGPYVQRVRLFARGRCGRFLQMQNHSDTVLQSLILSWIALQLSVREQRRLHWKPQWVLTGHGLHATLAILIALISSTCNAAVGWYCIGQASVQPIDFTSRSRIIPSNTTSRDAGACSSIVIAEPMR